MEINCNYEYCLQRELAGNAVITRTNLSSINLFIHTLTHPRGKTLRVWGGKVAAFKPMVCRAFDHVTWYHMESWWRIVQLKSGLCLGSSRDHDSALSEGIACLTSANDITDIQLRRDTPAPLACVCVCVEKQEGRESSSDRLAQQIACQCLIWKKFPSDSDHVLLGELRLKDSSSRDLNSTRTVRDSSALLIKAIKYVKCEALFCRLRAVAQLWEVNWGEQLSIKPLRTCEKGSNVDEWTWSCWQRQKPAQKERWGLLFRTEPRWHWGHRGQYDPCDLHVIPLLQLQTAKGQNAAS